MRNFKAVKISLASPQQILSWSYGEVKKAETINYRTLRAEVDGLMCERIFGPTKNYECYCGKYKKIRYKGITCDKCGVEVTVSSVRRERMGHIALVSPVAHIWYSHGVPNKLAIILDIMQKKLESVIYFSRYMIVDVNEEGKSKAIEVLNDELKKEKELLASKLNEKISDIIKERDDQINTVKLKVDENPDVIGMTVLKLETKYNQIIAKEKEDNYIKINDIETDMNSLIDLVQKVVVGETFSEEDNARLQEKDINFYSLQMGAEAIRTLLKKIDFNELVKTLKNDLNSTSVQRRIRAAQRLKYVEGLLVNHIDPSWIIMDNIAVIPPGLRPIVPLSGGRFASSDLNDLYRRVINRNNRLKRLIELGAPEIILRNEKRMLQESVDALFDNSHRSSAPVLNSKKLPLKSLSDNLRGKQGRFRQNLLGKRVDYSGRSVIIAGSDLKLDQCGLPKNMALELFRPFVMKEILQRGLAQNIKSAKTYFEGKSDEVWDILEDVIVGRPVLLNRAPTLHKQGIQAFFPVLISGSAIKLHPLVCAGFNADFDGDQMAVHLPLSDDAIEEAKNLMMAKQNLILEADRSPIMLPKYELVYGCFYLTAMNKKNDNEKIYYFADKAEAISAHDAKIIGLSQPIKAIINGNLIETTVGRIIFNETLPEGFEYVNYQVTSDDIKSIVNKIIGLVGIEYSVKYLDLIKDIGSKYATLSGYSVSIEDCIISPDRESIIDEAEVKINELESSFGLGLLTQAEKDRAASLIWSEASNKLSTVTWDNLPENNPIKLAIKAKAMKASAEQYKQIAGMIGSIIDLYGKIIPLPIKSNYVIGLGDMEYFVGTRATRKVFADVALKTAESGYLTRKLVDVAHSVIVRDEDCHTNNRGVFMSKNSNRRISFKDTIVGRVLSEDIVVSGEPFAKNTFVTKELSDKIMEDNELTGIFVRSIITCDALYGVCSMCYGADMSSGKLVNIGSAVGVIAAQSLGEPATQLTLNSKHSGGVAGKADLTTQGLPRAEELYEARIPKGKAIIAENPGVVNIIQENGKTKVKIISSKKTQFEIAISSEGKIFVEDGAKVKPGQMIYKLGEVKSVAPFKGIVRINLDEKKIYIESDKIHETEYLIPNDAELLVGNEEEVNSGQLITRGNIDPKLLLDTVGMEKALEYIIDNIELTYGLNGLAIDSKHIEVIVSQMARYVKIIDPGDSGYILGEYKDRSDVRIMNKKLREENKKEVVSKDQLMGITASSMRTESFLSSASFQEQVRVLSEAALLGKVDYLRGLKENVIIGKRIPVDMSAKIEN